TVFGAGPDNQFVDERVAHSLNLTERREVGFILRRTANSDGRARGCAIGADDCLFVGSGVHLSVHREPGDRNLKHDGIHVKTGHCVRSIVMGIVTIYRRSEHSAYSHAEVQGVKRRAEINEEWIIDGAGKNAYATAEVVNSLIEEGLIVRHGLRANVR